MNFTLILLVPSVFKSSSLIIDIPNNSSIKGASIRITVPLASVTHLSLGREELICLEVYT